MNRYRNLVIVFIFLFTITIVSGYCGDGIVESNEQCDDGNQNEDDDCSNNCFRILHSVSCDVIECPSHLNQIFDGNDVNGCPISYCRGCGDGEVDLDEECDDGNQNEGDGCSSQCKVEIDVLRQCGNGLCNNGEDELKCVLDCFSNILIGTPVKKDDSVIYNTRPMQIFWRIRDNSLVDLFVISVNREGKEIQEYRIRKDLKSKQIGNIFQGIFFWEIGNLDNNQILSGERFKIKLCKGDDNCHESPIFIVSEGICGDGFCEDDESVTSCPEDCKKSCSQCGIGFLNYCDYEECKILGLDIGGCLYKDEKRRECLHCNEYNVCSDYDQEKSCNSNDCNLGDCVWLEGSCKNKPVCGNGMKEYIEECETFNYCDDNDESTSDNCINCKCFFVNEIDCGDGNVDIGEDCDDGNFNNLDDCNNECKLNKCGDGLKHEDSENCDEGTNNGIICNPSYNEPCEFCTSECELFIIEGNYCGDGILDVINEGCDDGNLEIGDGCDNLCKIEPPTCNKCGEGLFDICDSSDCAGLNKLVPGCVYKNNLLIDECISCSEYSSCSDYGEVESCRNDNCKLNCGWNGRGCVEQNICGNNILENNEECDDGNFVNDDGCSIYCLKECEKINLQNGNTCLCDGNCIGGYCKEGVCTAECIDSDGGDFPRIYGKLLDRSGNYNDNCFDDNGIIKLEEVNCVNGKFDSKIIDCLSIGKDFRCLNGQCEIDRTCVNTIGCDDCLENVNELKCNCNGECLNKNCVSGICRPSCYDSDGGGGVGSGEEKVYGTVTKGGIQNVDICQDTNTLKEYVCTNKQEVSSYVVDCIINNGRTCVSGSCSGPPPCLETSNCDLCMKKDQGVNCDCGAECGDGSSNGFGYCNGGKCCINTRSCESCLSRPHGWLCDCDSECESNSCTFGSCNGGSSCSETAGCDTCLSNPHNFNCDCNDECQGICVSGRCKSR